MKKVISLILVLTMCFAFAACTVEPEGETLALASEALDVKYSDSEQEEYKELHVCSS